MEDIHTARCRRDRGTGLNAASGKIHGLSPAIAPWTEWNDFRARSRRGARRHCGLKSRSQREDRSSSSSGVRVSSRRLQNDGGSGNGNIGWPLKIPTSGRLRSGDGGDACAPVLEIDAGGWPLIRPLTYRTGLLPAVSSDGRSGAIGPDDTGPAGKAPCARAIRLGSMSLRRSMILVRSSSGR
jgi:hypothetical protein